MKIRTDISPHAAVIIGVLQGGTAQWLSGTKWAEPTSGAAAINLMLTHYAGHVWRLKPPNTVRWAPVLQMPGGTEVILAFRICKEAACDPANYGREGSDGWCASDKLVRVLRVEYADGDWVASTFEEPL